MRREFEYWMRDLFLRGNVGHVPLKKIRFLLEKMHDLQTRVEQLEIEQQAIHKQTSYTPSLETPVETTPPIQELVEEDVEVEMIAEEEEDLGYIMIPKPRTTASTMYKQSVRTLEEEALSTITKNRKEIIKQKIMGVASKGQMTAKRIKELIVDRHHYCSKATFYRYLQELKDQERMDTINLNGREYLSPTPQKLRNEQNY